MSGVAQKPAERHKITDHETAYTEHLREFGFHLPEDGVEPENMPQIRAALNTPREDLSPDALSDEKIREIFLALNSDNVKTAFSEVVENMLGPTDIPHRLGVVFNNLTPLTNGKISNIGPWLYDGCEAEEVHSTIRDRLATMIIPSTVKKRPCMPNFTMEVFRWGSIDRSERRALHSASLCARGIHRTRSLGKIFGKRLQSRVGDSEDPGVTVFDKKAYTLTAIFHSPTWKLQLYSIHPEKAEQPGKVKYLMSRVGTWTLGTSRTSDFRKGAAVLRNARDWAQRQRFIVLDMFLAKKHFSMGQRILNPTGVIRKHPTKGRPTTFNVDQGHLEEQSRTEISDKAEANKFLKRRREFSPDDQSEMSLEGQRFVRNSSVGYPDKQTIEYRTQIFYEPRCRVRVRRA